MIEQETYEKCLDLFVKKDCELRPWMTKPFAVGDYSMSTNSYALVWMQKHLAPNVLPPIDGESHIGVLKLAEKESNINKIILVSNIKKAIGKLNTEDEYTNGGKCDCCDGDGEVTYDFTSKDGSYYEKDFSCPECDGDGVKYKRKTGRKIVSNYQYLIVGKYSYKSKQIVLLLEACELLNADSIKFIYEPIDKNQSNEGGVFNIGSVNILIMPCDLNNDHERVEINE